MKRGTSHTYGPKMSAREPKIGSILNFNSQPEQTRSKVGATRLLSGISWGQNGTCPPAPQTAQEDLDIFQ